MTSFVHTRQNRPPSAITRLLALLFLFLFAHAGAAADNSSQESAAYTRAREACVEILINDRHAGSGWIADKQGRVVTAAHVLVGTKRLQVLLPNSYERATATLIAIDRGHDLALLQIDANPDSHGHLRLATRSPRTGDEIFVFGSPIFRHGVLLSGRLARSTPTFEYYGSPKGYIQCLHVSGMTPKGVSGGPWINSKGQVVGLQSGSMTVGTALQGVAFMIPLEAIERLLNQASDIHTTTIGIAIEETWQQDRVFLEALTPNTDGLVIRKLAKNSPAIKAGLKPMEIIVEMDGQPVRLPDQLLNYVRQKAPGETVELGVLDRTGTTLRTVTVTLQSL